MTPNPPPLEDDEDDGESSWVTVAEVESNRWHELTVVSTTVPPISTDHPELYEDGSVILGLKDEEESSLLESNETRNSDENRDMLSNSSVPEPDHPVVQAYNLAPSGQEQASLLSAHDNLDQEDSDHDDGTDKQNLSKRPRINFAWMPCYNSVHQRIQRQEKRDVR